jgi:xanthine dehydrogenase YagS FAD-binding subunit
VRSFAYVRPRTLDEAVKALAEGGTLKANGIDLLDRLKERVDEPERVVSIGGMPEEGLADVSGGWRPGSSNPQEVFRPFDFVVVGALATLAQVASSDVVRRYCPALSEAAGEAASPQIRNRATVGGNLAQHTRCGYYRHASFPCWKRGSESCPVLADGGVQETAAVFGNSSCASAHPSSLAPVMVACDAHASVRAGKDRRHVPVATLYEMPRQGKRSDTTLGPGEIIEGLQFLVAPRSAFVEVRRRAAFDWALVSCAAVVEESGGKVSKARVVLGSVAPIPWRAKAAEAVLEGKPWSAEAAAKAGEAAAAGATPLPGNAYKVDLVKVVVRRALEAAHARKR